MKKYSIHLLAVVSMTLVIGIVGITGCRKDQVKDLIQTTTSSEEPESFTWEVIPNQYIVVFNKEAIGNPQQKIGKNPVKLAAYIEGVIDQMSSQYGVAADLDVQNVYTSTINGFSAKMSEEAMQKLKLDSRIEYVEQDIAIVLRGKPGTGGGGSSGQDTPWGITRVNGVSSYNGSGVAWIIDTGIDLDHPDLEVDASRGFNAFTWGKDGKTLDDGNGHGTHVSGTIAAKNNDIAVIGVAPGATVIPVKVLSSSGSGSYSGVIAGIDWVGANGTTGDVANMSLGGPVSQAVDDAVIAAASASGVKFCLAAGNESDDANNHSPARANGTNVYTISAMKTGDNWASFSNYGNPPIDYCAPGVGILSTWKDGGTNTISGTSMATPHAAGVLLLGAAASGGTVNSDPDGSPDVIIVH